MRCVYVYVYARKYVSECTSTDEIEYEEIVEIYFKFKSSLFWVFAGSKMTTPYLNKEGYHMSASIVFSKYY
jgi:hypothetical protein